MLESNCIECSRYKRNCSLLKKQKKGEYGQKFKMAFALRGNKKRGYKMYYPFICPKCGHNEIIEMKISMYTASGHYCPICGEEMTREVKSLVCQCSIDTTNTFYRKYN